MGKLFHFYPLMSRGKKPDLPRLPDLTATPPHTAFKSHKDSKRRYNLQGACKPQKAVIYVTRREVGCPVIKVRQLRMMPTARNMPEFLPFR